MNAPAETAASPQIEIEVETAYLAAQSQPDRDRHVFAYHITIHHRGGPPAQLIDRYWCIRHLLEDGNEQIEEVRGPGVVGEQPHLEAGQSFRYQSGCVLKTPFGSMEGHYGWLDEQGRRFITPIARFALMAPRVLH